MSLLLDALRRAEEDSRKRKLATAALAFAPAPAPVAEAVANTAPVQPVPVPASVLQREAPKPELELQAQTHASVPGRRESTGVSATDASKFPDLIMAPVEMPATPNPGTDLPSYARYARPGSAEAAQAASAASAADSAAVRSTATRAHQAAAEIHEPLELAVPVPATTQRQALSAAGALAGASTKKAITKTQRRQWLLTAVALLVAMPLVALLLFGDRFFGTSGTLVAVNTPRLAEPLPANPPVAAPASPAEAPAPATVAPAAQETAKMVAPVAPVATTAPVFSAIGQPPTSVQAGNEADGTSRVRPVVAAPVRDAATRRSTDGGASREPPAVGENAVPVVLVTNTAKPGLGMAQAYAAYQAGQLDEASRLYREVLQADPTQRDAWLGLAVIAHSRNQRQPAMDAYRRVLRLEPQNATALAGLSSLASDAGDPRQESKLRDLLARSPQAADLNHALGLVLSGEKRWSEAQPFFFKAHALAPQEPEFVYNLAVALDHLRKSALAIQYYEAALRLAQGKAPGFDESGARSRLAALKADLPEEADR